jgi:hypothetical protein
MGFFQSRLWRKILACKSWSVIATHTSGRCSQAQREVVYRDPPPDGEFSMDTLIAHVMHCCPSLTSTTERALRIWPCCRHVHTQDALQIRQRELVMAEAPRRGRSRGHHCAERRG